MKDRAVRVSCTSGQYLMKSSSPSAVVVVEEPFTGTIRRHTSKGRVAHGCGGRCCGACGPLPAVPAEWLRGCAPDPTSCQDPPPSWLAGPLPWEYAGKRAPEAAASALAGGRPRRRRASPKPATPDDTPSLWRGNRDEREWDYVTRAWEGKSEGCQHCIGILF